MLFYDRDILSESSKFGGIKVLYSMDVEGGSSAKKQLKAAEKNIVSIRDEVAAKYAEFHNTSDWGSGRPKITKDQMVAAMVINSMGASPDRVTVYFEDGGHFGGHSIEVRIKDGKKVEDGLSG